MSTTTKKLMEGFDARISALECVSDGNRNFLILKRDIQSRIEEMAQSNAGLVQSNASLVQSNASLVQSNAGLESSLKQSTETLEQRQISLESSLEQSTATLEQRQISLELSLEKLNASIDNLRDRLARIEAETLTGLPAVASQLRAADQQHIINRIDALETTLKASDAANRALWKKLLYGTHRQA